MRRTITAFLLLVAGALALPQSASALPLYDADTGLPGFATAFPGYLQQITLAGPNTSYAIDNFTIFGIRYNANAPGVLILNFWTGLDLGGGAIDALAPATLVGQVGYNLPAAPVGSYNFFLPGVNVNVPSSTFGVEVILANVTATAYSTAHGGRFSSGAPLLGTNPGFVWIDNNLDGLYAGAEQAQLGNPPAPTNIRMVIDARLVPEPSTLALFGTAFVGIAGIVWRRRQSGK